MQTDRCCTMLETSVPRTGMSAPQLALWQRLERFRLDQPGASLPFSVRLARENNWKLLYTVRVVQEYKKFLFLACTAGHPVTPSVDVDQVWHLHLVYTHSYWKELCAEVLGMEIHHGPTPGGKKAQEGYRDLYKQTKASYRRFFEQEPPRDIWPSTRQRFGSFKLQWVDRARYWVLPKWW